MTGETGSGASSFRSGWRCRSGIGPLHRALSGLGVRRWFGLSRGAPLATVPPHMVAVDSVAHSPRRTTTSDRWRRWTIGKVTGVGVVAASVAGVQRFEPAASVAVLMLRDAYAMGFPMGDEHDVLPHADRDFAELLRDPAFLVVTGRKQRRPLRFGLSHRLLGPYEHATLEGMEWRGCDQSSGGHDLRGPGYPVHVAVGEEWHRNCHGRRRHPAVHTPPFR